MIRFGRVMMLIAAISLYAPHCLMWAATPGAKASSHCHEGKPAPQDPDMRPCCENEGVSVPTFHPQTEATYMLMAALDVDLAAALSTAAAESAFAPLASPPPTGSFLAELSVLRI